MNLQKISFLITFLGLFSCRQNNSLETVLDYAADNRHALENVLAHYNESPEKLSSAKFIIRNLPHWYSYSDKGELDSIENLLHQIAVTENLWYFKDITKRDWSSFNYTTLPRLYDCHTITDSLLIKNIDDAWKQRNIREWNVELKDDDFNNFILPHRIGDEKLSDWRHLYLSHYGILLDSLYPKGNDVLKAAEIIYEELEKENFKYNICAIWPHRKATDLFLSHSGPCRDQCDHAVYALRSVGIPCAVDTYFSSPETATSRQWVVVRDNITGRFIPLSKNMVERRDSSINDWRKKGKVYRYMPSLQNERKESIVETTRIKTPIRNYFIKDVTEEYFGQNSIMVSIDNPSEKRVMLGVFSPGEWRIIDYASEYSETEAVFKNIEPGSIYAPVLEKGESGQTKLCGFPFIFERDGSITMLKPSPKTVKLTINRKMPFMPWLYDWFSKGVSGGYFELSNSLNFEKSVRGASFPDTLDTNFHLSLFPPTYSKYVRLTVPGEDQIVIGQIEIYSDSTAKKKINCSIFSKFDGYFHPENAIDGDILSFFAMPKERRKLILELDSPQNVEAVAFIPRNNDNFVWPGDHYQLLYFDSVEKGWKEVDRAIAENHSLTFDAPENALYWLRDLTKGHEEQPFIWRNGKQVFVHDL